MENWKAETGFVNRTSYAIAGLSSFIEANYIERVLRIVHKNKE